MDLKGKVIIITGASSGIGEQTALELAPHKVKMVIAATRQDKLDEVAEKIRVLGSEVLVVPTNLTKVSDIKNLVDQSIKKFGHIDILANIAGWGVYKWFEDYKYEEIKSQFDINVLGLMELTRQVIPHMQAQHSGHIINMSSYASKIAVPPMTIYASTKYAVEGFSDGLRREMRPWGIKVSRVHPSPVSGTEFNALSRERGGVQYDSAGIGRISKNYVAKKLVELMQDPQPALFLGRLYDVPVFFNRFFPGVVDMVMGLWVKRQRKMS